MTEESQAGKLPPLAFASMGQGSLIPKTRGRCLTPADPQKEKEKKSGRLAISQEDSDWLQVFPAVDSTSWSESKE